MSIPCQRLELPYQSDSTGWFEALADRPWAVMLDSGHPQNAARGRYDILSAEPRLRIVTHGETTDVSGTCTETSVDDPFEVLRRHLGTRRNPWPDLPFTGGALGYFAYDLARRIETLPSVARDDEHMPEMAIGIYDWAIINDHRERRAWLVAQGPDAQELRWQALCERLTTPAPRVSRAPFRVQGAPASNLPRDDYLQAFHRIQHYIREGDCYQVNLAQRFCVPASGDPWLAYRRLRAINPAPFSAYLNLPFAQVLSASPERFLLLQEDRVETRPIKGTRPRHDDPAHDRALVEQLKSSVKDRAENLMIVDLLRNDLGKSCAPGSIRVPSLFEVESFATVHHLVSTIEGQLAAGMDALHLLRGCFPGGSITGAPKLRAMQIIEELEPNRRGVYCGSIGYIGYDGAMDTNIAIRTLVYSEGKLRFWAGGGIVADSSADAEYQETFDKAAAMLRLTSEFEAGVVDR